MTATGATGKPMTYGAPAGGWPQFDKKERDVERRVLAVVVLTSEPDDAPISAEKDGLVGLLEGAGYGVLSCILEENEA